MTPAERRTAYALLAAEGAALVSLRATIRATVDGGASARSLPDLARRSEEQARQTLTAVRLAAKRAGAASAQTDLAEVLRRDVQLRYVAELSRDEERRVQTDAAYIGAGVTVLGGRLLEKSSRASGPALEKALDGRVRTMAATQTGEAFNDERDAAATRYVQDPENVFLPVILRTWNALVDACPVCRGLNGTSRPLGVDYPNGQRPGYAHPHCRCFSTIMPIPAYITR